jgi:hypothetical protein
MATRRGDNHLIYLNKMDIDELASYFRVMNVRIYYPIQI